MPSDWLLTWDDLWWHLTHALVCSVMPLSVCQLFKMSSCRGIFIFTPSTFVRLLCSCWHGKWWKVSAVIASLQKCQDTLYLSWGFFYLYLYMTRGGFLWLSWTVKYFSKTFKLWSLWSYIQRFTGSSGFWRRQYVIKMLIYYDKNKKVPYILITRIQSNSLYALVRVTTSLKFSWCVFQCLVSTQTEQGLGCMELKDLKWVIY